METLTLQIELEPDERDLIQRTVTKQLARIEECSFMTSNKRAPLTFRTESRSNAVKQKIYIYIYLLFPKTNIGLDIGWQRPEQHIPTAGQQFNMHTYEALPFL